MNHRSSLLGLACTLVLPLFAVAACSSSSDSNDGVSADQAATDAASAICDALQKCSPVVIQVAYGDVATCKTRQKLGVLPALSANGTSLTPSGLAACARDLQGASCDQVTSRNIPESCRTKPGKLADGAACGSDQQCQNRLCRKEVSSSCGVCSKLGAAGDTCRINEDCDFGLGCNNGKCRAFQATSQTCNADQRCNPTTACKSGTCGTPAEAGQDCTAVGLESECYAAKGLACGLSNKCIQVQFVAPGQACGVVGGNFVSCAGGGRCTAPTSQGTCAAPAADGSPCEDDVDGPGCVAPARCIGKVCKLDDPAACK
ncbi:hypothetical protein LVJ94_40890 [Pendulispora rubella]|uniref:DUF7107 domain-containing protein n=1 Tax=Pendulispora rubella TaxID=2741070 RepID=A0ABZ2KX22_9BACT